MLEGFKVRKCESRRFLDVKIQKAVYDELIRAAEASAPNEACGIVAGRGDCGTDFYAMTNADASPVHFSMIPAEQFDAVRDIRKNGLSMLGIFHSHPLTPARMSDEDLHLALTPGVIHIIMSLASPDGPVIRGYEVDDEGTKEIEVTIVPG